MSFRRSKLILIRIVWGLIRVKNEGGGGGGVVILREKTFKIP